MAKYTTGGCGVTIVSEECPCTEYRHAPERTNKATGEREPDFCACGHHVAMHSTVEVQ